MKKDNLSQSTIPADEYLAFGIESLERIIAADLDRNSLHRARRAARLFKRRDVSQATDSLVELARDLDDRLATTGYVLAAVLSAMASCKHLLDEPVAASELETASSKLYRRTSRFRGSVHDTLDALMSTERRSRSKTARRKLVTRPK